MSLFTTMTMQWHERPHYDELQVGDLMTLIVDKFKEASKIRIVSFGMIRSEGRFKHKDARKQALLLAKQELCSALEQIEQMLREMK